MTWPALTPLEFSAACTLTAALLIALSGGLVWILFQWLPRKWAEAGRRVDELADPGSGCRWCESLIDDGRTTIGDCTCIIPCDEYKSWCAARRAAQRKGPQ